MTSAADFPVLHAVRLGGFSSSALVGERTMLAESAAGEVLRGLERQSLVEFVDFAGSGGWTLTEHGRERDAALHADEMGVPGVRQLVEEAAEQFESVNPRMVRTVTEWQLATPAGRAAARARTVAELDELYLELDELMARLVPALPRYGRYPRQFGAAAARARDGIDDAIAGVGTLSCHTVWAELHQDFVSGLGRERR